MYSNRRQAASLKHGSEQAVFTSRNPQSRFLHIGKPRPKKQPPILEPRLGIAAVSQFKDNELKRMLHNKNMLQSCSSRERETYIYIWPIASKQERERERKREREMQPQCCLPQAPSKAKQRCSRARCWSSSHLWSPGPWPAFARHCSARVLFIDALILGAFCCQRDLACLCLHSPNSTMPVKAPLPCGHCQVPLEQLSLEMSWRECDSSRLQELSQSFRAGDFGKSIMAAVSIISVSGTSKVDDHGHKCIEDGAHTVKTLLSMKQEFDAVGSEAGALGSSLCSKITTNGGNMTNSGTTYSNDNTKLCCISLSASSQSSPGTG